MRFISGSRVPKRRRRESGLSRAPRFQPTASSAAPGFLIMQGYTYYPEIAVQTTGATANNIHQRCN